MPKYLLEVRYTAQGAKRLAQEGGSRRRAAIVKNVEALGGNLEVYYHAFGDVDAYIIAEFPDTATAAAVAIAVNEGGGATVKTVVLISIEDIDIASKKALKVGHHGANDDL